MTICYQVAGGTMQFVHYFIDDFFGNNRPELDQFSSNIRQFEIWTKWTIWTSD